MARLTMDQMRALRDPDRRPRMNAQKYAQVIALLSQEPYTIFQMHEKIGCAKNTIKVFFAELKKWQLIHIAEWVDIRDSPVSGPLWVAAWTFGPGTDARRPPKFNPVERCRRYRERRKRKELDRKLGLNSASASAVQQDETDSVL